MTFKPTAAGQAGTADTYYLFTANDGQGEQKVMLTGKGVDDPIALKAYQIGAGDPRSVLGRSLTLEYPVAGQGSARTTQGGDLLVAGDRGARGRTVQSTPRYKAAGGAAGILGFPDHRRAANA